jgi:hypothetical protein
MSLPKINMNKRKWNAMHVLFESQYDLGLEVSSFDNIGTPALAFFVKVVSDEEY